MNYKGKTNLQDLKIQRLLDKFLRLRASTKDLLSSAKHLDEDSFAAFVEGNVSEREAQPIVSHLIDCSFCRNVTAELIKLEYAFAGEDGKVGITDSAPSKVSEVLSNLLSRIFGTGDGVVFAHQESEEEIEKNKKSEKEKE